MEDSLDLVKKYIALFLELRKEEQLSLRQPLLDFACGPNDDAMAFLFGEEINMIAEWVNIWKGDNAYTDRTRFWGFDVVKPEGDHWKIKESDDIWVALNVNIPSYLKTKYEEHVFEQEKKQEDQRDNAASTDSKETDEETVEQKEEETKEEEKDADTGDKKPGKAVSTKDS